MKEALLDVLAERYASTRMVILWSPKGKIVLERNLWVAAVKAQKALGVAIPEGAVEAYESVIEVVDFESIKKREAVTRQDVKARIEEFNALAGGFEVIHEGFTSRDLTDNVEQLLILESLKLVRERTVSVLARLSARAQEYSVLDMCGRSHNVPAQITTLGKRFATIAEELLIAFDHLNYVISSYPLRGIKGPMGTQQDMVDLLGSAEKALEFEDRIREHLGFSRVFDSVGQVYPRSLDFEALSTLMQLGSGPANLAKTIRLMAGDELVQEGFAEGQTGSSAMPHKISNSRTCERIGSILNILGGFLEMTKGLVGDQWYEGDVSCSATRRVALPGAFFCIDGIYESILTVLDEMQVFPAMINRELERYLPFLSSTRFLMAAVKKEVGRETAHGIIRDHTVEVGRTMREGGPNTLLTQLATDPEFPLNKEELEELMRNPDHGLAVQQVEKVCTRVAAITDQYPEAVAYVPEPIL